MSEKNMTFEKCARCGKEKATIYSNGKFFCAECVELFNTCGTCVYGNKCEFNTNPAPIPKFIMQKQRQQTEHGYIEQISQTVNPQRAKAFCLEGECPCHKKFDDGKIRCMKQFGYCENYKEIEY